MWPVAPSNGDVGAGAGQESQGIPQIVVQRSVRLPDQVAEAIATLIAQRRLVPDEKLPPERVLGERFGVSRTVIREAMRSLAAKRLVEVRAGGGVWVRQPSVRPAAELLDIVVQTAGGGVTWADVLEIRRLVEVEAAGLAAERRTDGDLAALHEAVASLRAQRGDPEAAARADMRFHDALAVASHNPLMPVLLGAMETVLLEGRRRGYRLADTPAKALLHHGRILRRVERADAAGARAAMVAHLRESEATLARAQALDQQH
jgi:GntR family transcriptional repressor for pyruvate dehydrogenase complex